MERYLLTGLKLSVLSLAHLWILTAVGVRADQVIATESLVGEWLSLELPGPDPSGHGSNQRFEYVSHAMADKGELFVADRHRVFARTPWGWELIWKVQSDWDRIQVLEVIEGAKGPVLLVGTDVGLFEISWHWRDSRNFSWHNFQYDYVCRSIRLPQNHAVRRIWAVRGENALGEKQARAFITDEAGSIFPVIVKDDLVVLPALPTVEPGGGSMWAEGPRGWHYTWTYRGHRLLAITPEGHLQCSIDLEQSLGKGEVPREVLETRSLDFDPGLFGTFEPLARNGPEIRSVAFDLGRRLLFIGSSSGLAVADLDEASLRPLLPIRPIKTLEEIGIRFVGLSAGRVILVSESKDPFGQKGERGTIFWEHRLGSVGSGAENFAARAKFRSASTSDGPGSVSEAVQVADDVIWADGDGLWEWAPGDWHRLEPNGRQLEMVSLSSIENALKRPVIIPELLGEKIFYCRPKNGGLDSWRVHRFIRTASFVRLVPDPTGAGVWTLEDPGQGLSRYYGYLRFVTPHGSLATRDGTTYGPDPFSVSRLSHHRLDGQVYWPKSRFGGLILPSGIHLLYVEGGEWKVLNLELQEGCSLTSMTPGAQSSHTAWLAILNQPNQGARVVRLDVAEGSWTYAQGPRVELSDTGASSAASEHPTLMVDSEGFVWLAREEGGQWQAMRIEAEDRIAPQTIEIGALPEPPVYLLHSRERPTLKPEIWIFTRTGYARIASASSSLKGWSSILQKAEPPEPQQRFLHLVRTATLGIDGLSDERVVLLTGLDPGFGFFGPTPGPAYELNLGSEGLRMKQIQDLPALGGPHRDRSIVAWFTGKPECIIWDRSNSSTTPLLQFPRRSPIETVPPLLPIDGLEGAADAVLLQASDAGERAGTKDLLLATCSGGSVAFQRLSGTVGWSGLADYVPILVRVSLRDQEREFDLRANPLPAELPHDARRLEVTFAPGYAQWWRDRFDGLLARDHREGRWQPVDQSGRISFRIKPGESKSLGIRIVGMMPGSDFKLRELGIRVHPEPPMPMPRSVLVLVGLSFCLIILIIASTLSPDIRWLIRLLLFQRWILEVSACEHDIQVSEDGQIVPSRASSTIPDTSKRAGDSGLPPHEFFCELRREWFKSGDRVSVLVAGSQFLRPWARMIGDEWSLGQEAIIAGQIARVNRPSRLPEPAARVVFRGLRCANLANRYLPQTDHLLLQIARAFPRWRSRAQIFPGDATVSEMRQALTEAHIILVVAHATPAGINLRDGRFGSAEFHAIPRHELRCRLILLAGCELGDLDEPEGSLVYAIVQMGVSVLASSDQLDYAVGVAFFEEICKALFSNSIRSDGQDLAGAIRAASNHLAMRFSDYPEWRSAVDSFILYGYPTLRIKLRWGMGVRGHDPKRLGRSDGGKSALVDVG